MVASDSFNRLVLVQFSFSNSDAIPQVVKRLKPETTEEQAERKSHSNGVLVIEPTANVSLVDFLGELEAAEFEIVDAFYKERIDPKDPRKKRTYHTVRFTFAHREYVDLSDEFKKVRDVIRTEFLEVCKKAMWRVRAFLNPYFEDGAEVAGLSTICINLEGRQPLFLPNGQPVVVWQKDEGGNRMGQAPIPLQPKYYLRVVDHAVQLEAA